MSTRQNKGLPDKNTGLTPGSHPSSFILHPSKYLSPHHPSSRAPAPELLAPAGGPEAAYAAFQYGADAVYLGLRKFSARADAENFTAGQLDALAGFAHAQTPRRRVFVTLNTLVLQAERRELVETLGLLSDLGVDALIVQDLGLLRTVRRHFPELRLHASTQMALHNAAGVEAARALGYARVTLARELTLAEVRACAAVPGIEVETFVHGALCYSYSGLCLFSSFALGRSGNRGRCAQPCRDRYEVVEAGAGRADAAPASGFLFSMKDLALPDYVSELRAAGVASLKIEGRKKSPLYVAAATHYYRRLLDGGLTPDERGECEADIQTIFSRPWTPLYLHSRREAGVSDRETVGHRGAPLGTVEAVVRAGAGPPAVRFRTARALQVRDGLQIEVPGLGRPFGFPVRSLGLVNPRAGRGAVSRPAFRAPAGALVEVGLPEGYTTVPEGAAIHCASSQEVKQRYPVRVPPPGEHRARERIAVDLKLSLDELAASARLAGTQRYGSPLEARARAAGPFSPAKEPDKLVCAVRAVFEKLGETRFSLGEVTLENPERLFVPVSRLNALRRTLIEAFEVRLDAAREARAARAVRDFESGHAPSPALPARGEGAISPPAWSIKVERLAYLDAFAAEDWAEVDEVVIAIARDELDVLEPGLARLAERVGRERIRLALPLLTRDWEQEALQAKIAGLRRAGWTKWEAAGLSAWTYLGLTSPAREARTAAAQNPSASALDVTADWTLYTLNLAAARQLLEQGAARVTLSPEDGLENLRALLAELGARATVLVYQDTPLFISETCALSSLRGACPGPARCASEPLRLRSRHGQELLVVTDGCRAVTLGAGPFCLSTRLRELAAAGARRLRADFILRPYDAPGVRERWRKVRAGEALPGGHVANFERGLL